MFVQMKCQPRGFPLGSFLSKKKKKNSKNKNVRLHDGTICTAHKNTVLFSLGKVEKKKHSTPVQTGSQLLVQRSFSIQGKDFRPTFFSPVYCLDCW